jgi:hypothetical protein
MFVSFVQLCIIGGVNDVELTNAKLPNQQCVLNICEGALLIIKPTCGPPKKGACEVRLTNQ